MIVVLISSAQLCHGKQFTRRRPFSLPQLSTNLYALHCHVHPLASLLPSPPCCKGQRERDTSIGCCGQHLITYHNYSNCMQFTSGPQEEPSAASLVFSHCLITASSSSLPQFVRAVSTQRLPMLFIQYVVENIIIKYSDTTPTTLFTSTLFAHCSYVYIRNRTFDRHSLTDCV